MLKIVLENLLFLVEFFGIVVLVFLAAFGLEKLSNKREGYAGSVLTTKKIAIVGLFSAISAVLMLFEVPLPFAPSFYKLDLSELPVLVVTFAFGPVAGVLTEFLKIVLKLFIKSTSTAFVGELANFCVGVSLVLPASSLYLFHKSRRGAVAGCVIGTLTMTVFGSVFNGVYLLPKFAQMYGMDLATIVGMGQAINPAIHSLTTFVLMVVAPLNLIKGFLISGVTVALYKKLSPIIKADHVSRRVDTVRS